MLVKISISRLICKTLHNLLASVGLVKVKESDCWEVWGNGKVYFLPNYFRILSLIPFTAGRFFFIYTWHLSLRNRSLLSNRRWNR